MLDLTPYLDRKPKQLSGGQRQRVAMGRAIVREPQVFLMDEPLSNLDAKLRVQMRAEIAKLQHELGTTTIYVTHDQVEAMTMGDRVAVMSMGVLQQVDAPQQLYDEPANLFVAGFIGTPPMNLLEAEVEVEGDGVVMTLAGDRLDARRGRLQRVRSAPRRRPERPSSSGSARRTCTRSERAARDCRRSRAARARRGARLRADGVLLDRREVGPWSRHPECRGADGDAELSGAKANLTAQFPPRSTCGSGTWSRSRSTPPTSTSSTRRPVRPFASAAAAGAVVALGAVLAPAAPSVAPVAAPPPPPAGGARRCSRSRRGCSPFAVAARLLRDDGSLPRTAIRRTTVAGARARGSQTGFDPTDTGVLPRRRLQGADRHLRRPDDGLARIKRLGFTALWVTPPVGQNTVQGDSAAYHGYWGLDFTASTRTSAPRPTSTPSSTAPTGSG